MLNKINKKFLLGAVLSMAVCFAACSEENAEITETAENTVSETTAEAAETSDGNDDGEDELSQPLTADPVSAVKLYLKKLSENENVVSLELRDTSIGQSTSVADKYYESPLAEQFGIENDTPVIPINTKFYIEYTEASGLESGEKNEYIVVKCGENGFEAIDTFSYDPKDYYGEVREILTNDDGDIRSYMVELDGGLGTVKCNNAVWYPDTQKIGIGERIYIYGNGDIYGDPPRIDAVSIFRESELSDDE